MITAVVFKPQFAIDLSGSVVTQMTPTQPATDFVDSFEVHNLIKMKGYFKGSSNVWDHALDGVVHQEIALCAFGGLTNHLSRLKAGLPS
nr:DNA mismatch repair protein MSH7 [Tanacetum cinerariifolium]